MFPFDIAAFQMLGGIAGRTDAGPLKVRFSVPAGSRAIGAMHRAAQGLRTPSFGSGGACRPAWKCPGWLATPRDASARGSEPGAQSSMDKPSAPRAGLKPIADAIRRMPPFGSPKRGRVARPNEAKRRRRRVVQVDPTHGGTDARVHRLGRAGRDRISRRTGFGGTWTASHRKLPSHRRPRSARPVERVPRSVRGGAPPPQLRRSPPDLGHSRRRACRTPLRLRAAYPLGPHSVRPLRRLAGGRAPS